MVDFQQIQNGRHAFPMIFRKYRLLFVRVLLPSSPVVDIMVHYMEKKQVYDCAMI